MEMEPGRRDDEGVLFLRVSGRLDAVTSSEFESELVGSLTGPGEPLVVDLSGVDYVSSAGLRALIVAAKTAGASGRRLALVGIRENVMEVIAIAGFDSFFMTFETEEAALRSPDLRGGP